MTPSAFRKMFVAAAGPLVLSLAGCGGGSPPPDDAVLVSAPDAKTSTAAAPTGGTGATPTPTPAATGNAAPTPAAPAAATKAEGWGTLKGRVVFGGTAPTPEPLVKQGDQGVKDAAVCAKEPVPSEKLVVGPDKGVKFALVYIPKPTKINEEAKSAAASTTVVFDQAKCIFEPHVLGVMVGAKVDLKSSDPVGHNVNSKVENNNFNLAIAPGQQVVQATSAPARRPGQVTCDIHPWMMAWWLVLDNPYFAVTDAHGNFEIKNAPAGTQKVVVWQEAATFVTPTSGQDVTIAAGGTTTQDFTIDAGKIK